MVLLGNRPQEEFWNARPGQMWVAHQTDLDHLHATATELLLAEAAPLPGETVLDIGCGAGATTLALADRIGPGGRVTGLDISDPLLARARERLADRANVTLVLGDAAEHAFAPAAADLVISRFGLMFFADPVAAFANIAAALRPGGRIVFVAWGPADRNPWFDIPNRAGIARLGEPQAGDPDAPGPLAFRDTDRVRAILAAAGLEPIEARGVSADLHHPGGLDAVMRLVPAVGPYARLMRELGGTEADGTAILAKVRESFGAFATPDGIRIPARFTLFSARRP